MPDWTPKLKGLKVYNPLSLHLRRTGLTYFRTGSQESLQFLNQQNELRLVFYTSFTDWKGTAFFPHIHTRLPTPCFHHSFHIRYWSWVASVCNSFKQGLSSWPETEFWSQQWERGIPATRPAVSDKSLALRLCRKRIPTKTESSETSKVYIRRTKKYSTCGQTHRRAQRKRVASSWQFKSLIWGTSSVFPLTNHFDLPGSESVFGASQDLPVCARASLSQDVVYQRGLWVVSLSWHQLASLSFWPPRSLSAHV